VTSTTDSVFVFFAALAAVAYLVILVDGWVIAPRQLAAGKRIDGPRAQAYVVVLVAACLGALWRLLRYEAAEFSLVLVVLGAVAGVVWAIDALFFAGARHAAATAASSAQPAPAAEPVGVEYARSFFPIIVVVLVIRSFLFEPFQIPSDSMMPTLYDGDFIFVSKYAYGLRLPVSNTLIYATGKPQRGDVVVFRLPPNPKINYIKRLVGLPGDRIRVDENNVLYINGHEMHQSPAGDYHGPKQDSWENVGAQTAYEQLDHKRHRVMFANKQLKSGEWTVPDGYYFFMGDNRNNSTDSRFTDDPGAPGFVPERNLVGKAVRIWMNFTRSDGFIWSRIGSAIE
jgi:signal peptidase I